MWMLGAGASASAGVATAWDMIWEFKQRLYLSQRRDAPHAVADLSSDAVRNRIQSHIDASGRFPPPDDPVEYAALFEATYPAEMDRQRYIDLKLAGAKPSYGHVALASMMRGNLVRLVWTTNFDSLVDDACVQVFGTTARLTTVALDAPALSHNIQAGRWPVQVKLHGDFRSQQLKNTTDELRQQDQRLRQVLVDECRRGGLIVAGYSGRDDSVMDVLEEALDRDGAYPFGLYWLHRGTAKPLPRVVRLLKAAADKNVKGGLVRIENFDEVLRDLVRMCADLDTSALDTFAAARPRWSAPPAWTGRKNFPVLRFNALPVLTHPTVFRRVRSGFVGTFAELRGAVEQSGADILFARTQAGILAYGADAEVRRALSGSPMEPFELYPIEKEWLRNESTERGLLRAALSRAISRGRGMEVKRRYAKDMLRPADVSQAQWAPLKGLVGSLAGTVPGHPALGWYEGVGLRLDWADGRLWLLFEPRTFFEGTTDDNRGAAADFARERTVKRYNHVLNALFDFWSGLLAGDGTELRAMGTGDGVDAVFTLGRITAFSKRAFG